MFLLKVSVFDDSSNNWLEGVEMNSARYGPCGVSALGGVIVVTGGQEEGERDLRSVEIYDTAAGGGWREINPMRRARRHHGCTVAYNEREQSEVI